MSSFSEMREDKCSRWSVNRCRTQSVMSIVREFIGRFFGLTTCYEVTRRETEDSSSEFNTWKRFNTVRYGKRRLTRDENNKSRQGYLDLLWSR